MKIGILDCHDESYAGIAKICNKSKHSYCKTKKIDFIEFKFDQIKPYGPTWGRLFGIERHLPNYDWLLYLDTDTIITNFDFELESMAYSRFNVVLGRMPDFNTGISNHLSTSCLFVKNDPWTFEFIQLWKKQTQFIDHPYYAEEDKKNLSTLGVGGLFFEQSALHYLYDNSIEVQNKLKIIDGLNDREVTHSKDSFLIHFARSPKEKRIKYFMKKRIKI
jgi:hypothetical protein